MQSRVCQRLQLIEDFKFLGVGYVIEQIDGGILGVHQPIGLTTGIGPHGKPFRHYHCAPRRLSIRRNDSYREIMSP